MAVFFSDQNLDLSLGYNKIQAVVPRHSNNNTL